ncbi:Wzz/FepE/Etk N-terminal domain-containing protein [Pseudomonas sp. LRF_L74]|uniref:Wzz/FepE/Etk N-terminal domain-containing protein n=1 Tax=Pseudomonas sp. LRF_L74 TaxID=3369422 RepID=UPI003F5DD196
MSTQPEKRYAPSLDEVDLVELFQKLWQQKYLIIACTLAVTACAAGYAWLATPYYQVQSMLRPAPLKELDEINSTGVYSLTPEDALQRVGAALDSYSSRSQFFLDNQILFEPLKENGKTLEQTFEEFNEENFTLLQPDPKKTNNLSPYVGLRLEYPASADGVSILNGIVQQAISDERARVALDLEGVIQNQLNKIERQMAAARASYEASKESSIAKLTEDDKLQRAILEDELKALRVELRTRRLNRIVQLNEAIAIAESLGIIKPTNPTSLSEAGSMTGSGNVFRAEVISQQFPLQFMGTEALEAERAILLKRRSDDHTEPKIATIQNKLQMLEHNRQIEMMQSRENEDLFLAKLAEMREEAARLKNIQLNLDQLNLVRIDQPAIKPLRPIKPKKMIILALGIALGGMFGVLVALIRTMLVVRSSRVA